VDREVGVSGLAPDAVLLAAAVALDLLFGDPQYRWHPVRLMGASVAHLERALRAARLDGDGGGIVLGLLTGASWMAVSGALVLAAGMLHPALGAAIHVLIAFSLLALRDLLDHVWAVERAARTGDLAAARFATSRFVARDTAGLDIAACRRASIESLSENLTDGYVSPLFWYAAAGLPGLVVFKMFSTLDSMVGNKSERYLRFGWFSARTDDVLNWLPARLTWLILTAVAVLVPGCSARKALAVGWRQHAVVPGPNSGWSEAATAGAIQRRLVGPIVLSGVKVTDTWLGDPADPPAGEGSGDLPLAMRLTVAAGLAAAALAAIIIGLRIP
jgi:adenosylcobinamide-phosphate synthase